MKRSLVLLTGVGVGAGLLYLFKSSQWSSAPEPDSLVSTRDGTAPTSHRGNGQSLSAKSDSNTHGRSSMRRVSEGNTTDVGSEKTDNHQPVIDDRGTDQNEAAEILKSVRDAAFDSNNEKLALALGRPTEEIEAWTSGSEEVADIDGDVVMKARTLAINRGVEI